VTSSSRAGPAAHGGDPARRDRRTDRDSEHPPQERPGRAGRAGNLDDLREHLENPVAGLLVNRIVVLATKPV